MTWIGTVRRLFFSALYGTVVALFVLCGMVLVVLAAIELWGSVVSTTLGIRQRFTHVLEAIGLLAVAIASFELSQTVLEEEIQRHLHLSAPTRVRRFLSRFLVVIVVALSIETLISVFRMVDEDPARLPQAASVGFAVAAMLIGWGVFLRLNKAVEELEPQAMEQAKREDAQVE